jgi:hypothetical protein
VRPRRVVRFARLMQRRVRVLGGPAVRAACGGSLSLPWLARRVTAMSAVPRHYCMVGKVVFGSRHLERRSTLAASARKGNNAARRAWTCKTVPVT